MGRLNTILLTAGPQKMLNCSKDQLYCAIAGVGADPSTLSPQHNAVLDNDIEALEKLLESGKSVNIINDAGTTPLHMSIRHDRKDIFDYLLTVEDIHLDAADLMETTPLMVAVAHKRDSYVMELIRRGADLNYQQVFGNTALHLGVFVNNKLAVAALLQHGAYVNCQNFLGETPLNIAVENGETDLLHILLYYGAIGTIYDKSGFLPFFGSFSRCPEYLQDILFDMTFDNDSVELELYTLVPWMFKPSNIFYKILEKISVLIYNKYYFEFFHKDWFTMKAELVKALFLRFPQLFEDVPNPLRDCVNFLNSPATDVDNATQVICFFCENFPTERLVDAKTRDLIQRVIHLKLPEAILSELLCAFLSAGFELSTHDLNMVYKTYGYGQLFKILLNMSLENYHRRKNFFPTIIYDVELISSFCGVPNLEDDDVRRITSRFFVTDSHVVPSLLQLSRDVARKHLIKYYKVRDNVQFFTLLRWLPIPEIHKSILGLEQEIYPTQK